MPPISVLIGLGALAILAIFVVAAVLPSIRRIGPTEVGLVTKRFSKKKLSEGNPIAFNGEAGYQAQLLMPGLRWKFNLVYKVDKYPWVQVPADGIGVVIAQVGQTLPTGAKSAEYKPEFGSFEDLKAFVDNGGQKGVQRPVLPPGTLLPIHPIAFLVMTSTDSFGEPISDDVENINVSRERLRPLVIAPDGQQDVVGVVRTLDGPALESGDMAGRMGGYDDVAQMEAEGKTDAEIIEKLLGNKNQLHNNYQDFQAFLDNGGRIGLQHDPLLYGKYLLNPLLVEVEIVPMLVVQQGEVAVITSYVGRETVDTSGGTFKFGSIVKPGHRGIWAESLRTGKYTLNPRIYEATLVPTKILTLNWAKAVSTAHDLDAQLSQIVAKSNEGFIFSIDLQVQIHVPDTMASRVISRVGSMKNLVNEVLQAAVGNHFRDTLQSMPAVDFIQKRKDIQVESEAKIRQYLGLYEVETPGVYIQDVILPEQLVHVLTEREIANQEKATYEMQKDAQLVRVETEKARGTAEQQSQLAAAQVGIEIKKANAQSVIAEADGTAEARKKEAEGEAAYRQQIGAAEGAAIKAKGLAQAEVDRELGLAKAAGLEAQKQAVGEEATMLVNVINSLSENNMTVVPQIQVSDGSGAGGGLLQALFATALEKVALPNGHKDQVPAAAAPDTKK